MEKFSLSLADTSVTTATYLRGIDGKTPGAPELKAEAKISTRGKESFENSQSKPGEKPTRPREAPEGTDQSDYLRRLAADLELKDRRLQKAHGRGFDAVLVVGSDVYDKLQVLRALRPRIDSSLFVTTNLDARLFHPDELKVTRNLIVISAFGLQLAELFQRGVPPFRDSFQTAAFAGTLCALGQMTSKDIMSSAPRIYEVGLDGPVDLSVYRDLKPGIRDIHGDFDTANLDSSQLLRTWRGAVIALPFLLAFVGAGAVSGWKTLYTNRIAILAAAVLVILFFLRQVPQNVHAGDEPFALLSGVSIWPSEVLRLFAFILSIHFVGRALSRLNQNDLDVAKQFDLEVKGDPPSESVKSTSAYSWIHMWLQRTLMLRPYEEIQVRQLWSDYCYASATRRRLIVSSVLSLVYLAVVFALAIAAGGERPLVPARGTEAFTIDKVILWAAIIANTLLIFFTLHATWLETRIAYYLGHGSTAWPDRLLNRVSPNRSERQFIDELLDIQFLAKHSIPVTSLVYYPFFTVSLMVLARVSWFDGWTWPLMLWFVFGFQLLALVGCVFALRATAEAARARALEVSRNSLWRIKRQKSGNSERRQVRPND